MIAFASTLVYVPDLARGESLNVGMALVVPDIGYADIRVAHDLITPLRRFDPQFDETMLERIELNMRRRMKRVKRQFKGDAALDPEDVLSELVRTSGGSKVMLAPFRPIYLESKLTDGDANLLIADLLERDVYWRREFNDSKRSTSVNLETRVAVMLREMNLLGGPTSRVQEDYRPSYLDDAYDFGFMNGTDHLLETADVKDVSNNERAYSALGSVLAKLELAKDEAPEGRQPQCYALLSGQRKLGTRTADIVRVLYKRKIQVYFVDEEQEQKKLKRDIERALSS